MTRQIRKLIEEVTCNTVLQDLKKRQSSQWPIGLRFRSAISRLLRLWVRIPPGHGCLSVVSVVCCEVEIFATI